MMSTNPPIIRRTRRTERVNPLNWEHISFGPFPTLQLSANLFKLSKIYIRVKVAMKTMVRARNMVTLAFIQSLVRFPIYFITLYTFYNYCFCFWVKLDFCTVARY